MQSNPKLFFPTSSEEPFPRFPRYTRYFHGFHDKYPPGGHPRSIYNSVFCLVRHLWRQPDTPLFATTLRASADRRCGKPIRAEHHLSRREHQPWATNLWRHPDNDRSHGSKTMSVNTYAQIRVIHSRPAILESIEPNE
jgi:hypothetical protein